LSSGDGPSRRCDGSAPTGSTTSRKGRIANRPS
jgi:hypothetical protein